MTPRSRAKLALIISLSLIGVLVVGVVGAVLFVQHRLDGAMERFDDPFADLGTDRPTAPRSTDDQSETADPVNILILGSDSRIRSEERRVGTACRERRGRAQQDN